MLVPYFLIHFAVLTVTLNFRPFSLETYSLNDTEYTIKTNKNRDYTFLRSIFVIYSNQFCFDFFAELGYK
jgi:hypothetical protein